MEVTSKAILNCETHLQISTPCPPCAANDHLRVPASVVVVVACLHLGLVTETMPCCFDCDRAIRTGTTGVKCKKCDHRVHSTCAGQQEGDWICSACEAASGEEPTLRDIMTAITKSNKQQGKLVRDVEAQAKLIRDAEANLGKSIEECHKRVEDAVKATEDVKAELDAMKAENHALRDRVRFLEERLAATEQYSRVNDVEVHGVPYKKGENLTEILSSLGNALSYPMTPETVEVAHRIGRPSESRRGIYVRFARKPYKSDFLQARKVKRDLCVRHLSCFPPGPRSDDPIYINESLSPEMRSIFNRARDLKKEKCIHDVWFHNGKLFLKKTATSDKVQVKSNHHLTSLCP